MMRYPSLFMGFWLLAEICFASGCANSTSSSNTKTNPVARSGPGVQQSAGAVQNVRQAGKRVADSGELKHFALAYYEFVVANNRGPASVEDLRGALTPKMIQALKDNSVYVVIWNIRNPSSETIIAYVAEPDSYGTRMVAKGDGSVVRMTQEEFDKAKPKR
jgi:hypothetical protein